MKGGERTAGIWLIYLIYRPQRGHPGQTIKIHVSLQLSWPFPTKRGQHPASTMRASSLLLEQPRCLVAQTETGLVGMDITLWPKFCLQACFWLYNRGAKENLKTLFVPQQSLVVTTVMSIKPVCSWESQY